MTEQPKDTQNTENTDLEELNSEGVGGTIGEDSSFEPEEDENAEQGGNA